MTNKQIETYDFIKAYTLAHGYVPTIKEIAEGDKGYHNKSSVAGALLALHNNGYIHLDGSPKERTYTVKGLKIVEV